MEIKKILNFNDKDIKTVTKFRTEIFNPMCDLLADQCELCPFKGACGNIENFLNKIITDKQWCVPKRGE